MTKLYGGFIEAKEPEGFSRHILMTKYAKPGEETFGQVVERCCLGVYEEDIKINGEVGREAMHEAAAAMRAMLWMPGGRIFSGAGTKLGVALMNCVVNDELQDSSETVPHKPGSGIWDALRTCMLTMRMGPGVGTDFSPLRPRGALVRGTTSESSGPIPYMDVWDQACRTVESAGERRGAMMATLRCDHPDIEEFIEAKRTAGRLTNFNISVLVTDAFMECVRDDRKWDLWHEVPPHKSHVIKTWSNDASKHIYKTIRARDLWAKIMRSTYDHAEPGVIFIDRVNKLNPLSYCETISCTNPCGEQPLPPNNNCDLGHVNLARLVLNPFSDHTAVDFYLLRRIVRLGVRFLDNVLDVTKWPTSKQREEGLAKRRIGLGVAGLADMLQQLRMPYGSDEAREVANSVMEVIADEAYRASADLAAERGNFPAYQPTVHYEGEFFKGLHATTQAYVKDRGLRNGVLLTVAPTGTMALVYDCVSGGIEPTFDHVHMRKVKRREGEFEEHLVEGYGFKLYRPPPTSMPWMATARDLSPRDHLLMLATAQRWVDASISKTINCPAEIDFDAFEHVYMEAYRLGCKSVTTYRPANTAAGEIDVRGSVLTSVKKPSVFMKKDGITKRVIDKTEFNHIVEDPSRAPMIAKLGKRPKAPLPGKIYPLKIGDFPTMYAIVGDATFPDGRCGPVELFLCASEMENHGWATGVARLVSFSLRNGNPVSEIVKELKAVFGVGGYADGKWTSSYVDGVARILEQHANALEAGKEEPGSDAIFPVGEIIYTEHDFDMKRDSIRETAGIESALFRPACPSCRERTLIKREGCLECTSCDYKKC